jgi:hypothetical protein
LNANVIILINNLQHLINYLKTVILLKFFVFFLEAEYV